MTDVYSHCLSLHYYNNIICYNHTFVTEIPLWHHLGIQASLECLFKDMEPAKP